MKSDHGKLEFRSNIAPPSNSKYIYSYCNLVVRKSKRRQKNKSNMYLRDDLGPELGEGGDNQQVKRLHHIEPY